jgi:hypothetical protein
MYGYIHILQMQRFQLHIYTTTLVAGGVLIGGPTAYSLISGEWSLPILIRTIGGCGLMLAAVDTLLRTDPDEFSIPPTGLLVGAVCLCGLGTVLFVISGG